MKFDVICFALILSLFAVAPTADALEVKLSGDQLTVRADSVPLQQILRRLSTHGVQIRIDPEINPIVVADLRELNVQNALEKLIRPHSHVIIWQKATGETNRAFRVAEIRIFRPGLAYRAEILGPLPELRPAPPAGNGALHAAGEILLYRLPEMDETRFRKLLDQIGGKIVAVNEQTGVYRIQIAADSDIPALVERVSAYPGVGGVEPNWIYRLSNPVRFSGASLPPGAVAEEALAGGAVVAVLDSGLAPHAVPEGSIQAALDVWHPAAAITDATGHGTQMALIASGAVLPVGAVADHASQTPVISIRVFDENGNTSAFHVMESIDFALENGARVMSLSWGSPARSQFLEAALNAARDRGMVVVASAGNEPTGQPVYPAAYPSVVGVGALGADGDVWENSNYGDFVGIYAPGVADMPVGYGGEPGMYAGTSISAAYTAHVIAHYLSEHPAAGLKEIFEDIYRR